MPIKDKFPNKSFTIQIQHLLKLNLVYHLISSCICKKNSNTTLVKVKCFCTTTINRCSCYSNTTLVKVKFRGSVPAAKDTLIQIQHLLKLNLAERIRKADE